MADDSPVHAPRTAPPRSAPAPSLARILLPLSGHKVGANARILINALITGEGADDRPEDPGR